MMRRPRYFQNVFFVGIFCFLFLMSYSCQQAGRDVKNSDIKILSPNGDLIGLNLTSYIAPHIQLEIKDSLKDLVDLPIGDSAIDAAIKAAGDYFSGGAKPISEAVVKGVEAATQEDPSLTQEKKDKIASELEKGLLKDKQLKEGQK